MLPIFYSDNYHTLAPLEQVPVHLTFQVQDAEGAAIVVRLQGWNTPALHLQLLQLDGTSACSST